MSTVNVTVIVQKKADKLITLAVGPRGPTGPQGPSSLTPFTTDNLVEGSTNKYYHDTEVDAYVANDANVNHPSQILRLRAGTGDVDPNLLPLEAFTNAVYYNGASFPTGLSPSYGDLVFETVKNALWFYTGASSNPTQGDNIANYLKLSRSGTAFSFANQTAMLAPGGTHTFGDFVIEQSSSVLYLYQGANNNTDRGDISKYAPVVLPASISQFGVVTTGAQTFKGPKTVDGSADGTVYPMIIIGGAPESGNIPRVLLLTNEAGPIPLGSPTNTFISDLDLNSNDTRAHWITFRNQNGEAWFGFNSGGDVNFGTSNAQPVSFWTNNTERVLIDGSGVVSMGDYLGSAFNTYIQVNDPSQLITLSAAITSVLGSLNATGHVQAGSMYLASGGAINFQNSIGGFYATIDGSTITSNYTLHLPTGQGGAGQAMVNDGAGNLSWTSLAPTKTGSRASPTLVSTAGVLTPAGKLKETMFVAGNLAPATGVTIASPSSTDLLELTLFGTSATNTVTIPNGGNLELNGDWIAGNGSILRLMWDGASKFTEVSRNDL